MGLWSLPTAGEAFFPIALLAYALRPAALLLYAARRAAALVSAGGGGSGEEAGRITGNQPGVVTGVRVTRLKLGGADGGDCCVCLRGFGEEEEEEVEVSQVVACRHFFHRECLERWLSHLHSTCPLCRSPVW